MSSKIHRSADRMDKVRLGIIGLGSIGKRHAKIASAMNECELVSVCDAEKKAEKAAETLGVKFYTDYQEMIEKEVLDGVIISVPSNLHVPVGITCAKRGLPILVEKPLATNLAEADRLIEAVKQNRVRLLVGHHKRFHPSVEFTRNMIKGGQIGRLVGVTMICAWLRPMEYFQISWRKNKGGGPILINLIHDIDNLRYMCGEVIRVYAEISNEVRKFPVEDSACVSLRLENGGLANIFISDCVPSMWSYEATAGETPAIVQSSETCYYFFGTEASLTFPYLKKVFYPDPSKMGWYYPISSEDLEIPWSDPHETQLKHFCKVITGEENPRTTGEDARRTLEVTLAVLQSGETGQPIHFKGR